MRYVSPWYWLLLGLLLLLFCWPVSAQPAPSLADSQSSIEQTLTDLQTNLQMLKTRLAERSIALSEAKRQLTELRSELGTLQTRLSESQSEIQTLTDSLTQSQAALESLQTTFEEYQMECEDALRRARILWFSVGAFIVGALALVFAL